MDFEPSETGHWVPLPADVPRSYVIPGTELKVNWPRYDGMIKWVKADDQFYVWCVE